MNKMAIIAGEIATGPGLGSYVIINKIRWVRARSGGAHRARIRVVALTAARSGPTLTAQLNSTVGDKNI